MQIRHLRVSNFRGIASLEWTLGNPFCCLIEAAQFKLWWCKQEKVDQPVEYPALHL